MKDDPDPTIVGDLPYEHVLISLAEYGNCSVIELEQNPFWIARLAEHAEALGWARRRWSARKGAKR